MVEFTSGVPEIDNLQQHKYEATCFMKYELLYISY